jgi:Spy/CpxP family protein refolding chaperone
MRSFKATLFLVTCFTSVTLIAQRPSPTQNPGFDTGLASTPTPQQSAASKRHTPSADKQAKHLAKQLGLNRDQVAQIRPILGDRNQQIEQIRSDATLAPRDRRGRMLAVQQGSTAKIEALLNDTQKQQFEQIVADRRNRARHSPKA